MYSKLFLCQYIFVFANYIVTCTEAIDDPWTTLILDKKEGYGHGRNSGFSRRNAHHALRHVAASSTFDSEEELGSKVFETQIRNPVFASNILTRNNDVYSFPMDANQPSSSSTHSAGSSSIVKCSRPGYLENPINCQKFYNCIKFGNDYQLFSLNCVEGTIFYFPLSKCVNPNTISHKLRPICIPESSFAMRQHTTTSKPFATGNEFYSKAETFGQQEQNTVKSSIDFRLLDEKFEIKTESPSEEVQMDDGFALKLKGREIIDEHVETFLPVVGHQNYSRASNIEELEFDYSTEPVEISIFDSIDMQSDELQNMETPNRNRATPPLNRGSKPKVWFGFRSKDHNVVSSIGNPFREDETTLAVILDFATSRLQIYSKNKLSK